MPKKYKKWAKMKSIIEKFHLPLVGDPRDIFWAYIGTNIGKEICGHGDDWRRPVLILRRHGALYTVLPMTTGGLYKDSNGIWVVKQNHHKVRSINFGFDSYIIKNQVLTIDGKRFISKTKDNLGNDAKVEIPEFLYIKGEIKRMLK